MRSRTTLLGATVLAVAATLPLAGLAQAQVPDRDCPQFSSQQEAQAAYDAVPGDRERLDANRDGVACESHDYGRGGAGATDKSADKADGKTAEKSDKESDSKSADKADKADKPAEGTDHHRAAEESDHKPAKESDAGRAPRPGAAQIVEVPRGGVETGSGPGSGDAPVVLLLGGLAALGSATIVVTRRASRRT